MRTILVALPLLAATVTGAQAHGVWLAEHAGELTVVYGVGPHDDPYKPDKVKSVTASTSGGEARPAKIVLRDKNAVIETTNDAAIIVTVMDNGFWTKNAEGKSLNLPKSAVPGGRSTNHTLKFNTHIRASTGGAPKPTGAALEIVPLADPFSLKPGGNLPVQVLLDAKPLANVMLHPDYVNDANAHTAKTDANGKVTVVVRNDGLNVVALEYEKLTPGDKDVDKITYAATLSFLVDFKEAD